MTWYILKEGREDEVQSEDDLRARLARLGGEKEPTMILKRGSGNELFIAARDNCALLIFRPSSRRMPILEASIDPGFTPNPDEDGDWYEFTAGGTESPVPKDRCIPLEKAMEIVLQYYRHESLADSVSWVEP